MATNTEAYLQLSYGQYGWLGVLRPLEILPERKWGRETLMQHTASWWRRMAPANGVPCRNQRPQSSLSISDAMLVPKEM